MTRDDSVYLRHILDAIHRIERYLSNVTREQFLREELLQDGVVRQLEIIGEACRHISDELRQKYPAVPWSQIIGMRNRIIHEYFNVDLNIVWEVVQKDLPELKGQVKTILSEMGRI
ncbi:HepT-like ribonuclease domain-containing protein [Fervidibacter sp.]|jgi:uncharacterized protein with HEPN domain